MLTLNTYVHTYLKKKKRASLRTHQMSKVPLGASLPATAVMYGTAQKVNLTGGLASRPSTTWHQCSSRHSLFSVERSLLPSPSISVCLLPTQTIPYQAQGERALAPALRKQRAQRTKQKPGQEVTARVQSYNKGGASAGARRRGRRGAVWRVREGFMEVASELDLEG